MKKKILISLIIVMLLIIIVTLSVIFYLNKRTNDIILIQDSKIIEYGNTYSPSAEELIDLSKYNFIDLNKLNIESNIVNEIDKEYPAVGEYEIKVHYKDKLLTQNVEVKDTTPPEILIQDSIEIDFETDLNTYNFKDLININDLSETKEYNINLDNVNVGISGEYIAKVSVEDIYSNKSEKEFKIIVKEKQEESIVETSNNNKADNIAKESNNNSVNKSNNTNNNNNSNNKIATDTQENTQTNNMTEKKQEEQEKVEQVQEKVEQVTPERCTNNNNHAVGVGNSGKWFNSKNEAIAEYNEKRSYWGNLWTNYQIDNDTYYKNCPSGYEIWSCMFCNKWTINFYY